MKVKPVTTADHTYPATKNFVRRGGWKNNGRNGKVENCFALVQLQNATWLIGNGNGNLTPDSRPKAKPSRSGSSTPKDRIRVQVSFSVWTDSYLCDCEMQTEMLWILVVWKAESNGKSRQKTLGLNKPELSNRLLCSFSARCSLNLSPKLNNRPGPSLMSCVSFIHINHTHSCQATRSRNFSAVSPFGSIRGQQPF